MYKKAFVLLSGGLDSTTCLFKAIYEFAPHDLGGGYGDPDVIHKMVDQLLDPQATEPTEIQIPWVEAISIDYGQRHKKETLWAAAMCARLGIKHTILTLPSGTLSGEGVMLTDSSMKVPDISYSQLTGVSPTYVPFRNGTLLAVITAHAQKWVNEQINDAVINQKISKAIATENARDLGGIYFGAHSEDAHNWAYPDCTPEFIGAMANAIYVGTYYAIRLYTPLMWLQKHEIVSLGYSLGVPFEDTWSCYKGEELQCGTCPTCLSRKEAFRLAGIPDPTKYAA